MNVLFTLVFLIFTILFPTHLFAITKEKVVERDLLHCGVSTGIPGFSNVDGKGVWSGLDVDVCKAVAAAVLGDAQKVKFIPLLPKERVTALLSGDVDILSRNLAWNLTRDSSHNMSFATVTFHDLQGFLASKKLSVKSLLELKEFNVCLQLGSIYLETLEEYLQESKLKYKTVVSETPDQIIKDFEAERCQVITGGMAQLQGLRSKLTNPADSLFLTEIVTNVPLGPAVRYGDDSWFDIVKWSVFAMIYGEELQLTSANIDSMVTNPNRTIQRFMGLDGIGGKGLGLRDDWAYQIIKQVGNYGESFERNLGESSPLKLKRGLNNLWNKGGLMFAPPLR